MLLEHRKDMFKPMVFNYQKVDEHPQTHQLFGVKLPLTGKGLSFSWQIKHVVSSEVPLTGVHLDRLFQCSILLKKKKKTGHGLDDAYKYDRGPPMGLR